MNTLSITPTVKVFLGGTHDVAQNAYKAWLGGQRGIEIVGGPTLEVEGRGWKLSVWYRPSN
jgi:hypothetical protein